MSESQTRGSKSATDFYIQRLLIPPQQGVFDLNVVGGLEIARDQRVSGVEGQRLPMRLRKSVAPVI